jgi:hypothetical protein
MRSEALRSDGASSLLFIDALWTAVCPPAVVFLISRIGPRPHSAQHLSRARIQPQDLQIGIGDFKVKAKFRYSSSS